MLHVICVALFLMAALAETSVMRQWARQYELANIQQAAAGAASQSSYGRN